MKTLTKKLSLILLSLFTVSCLFVGGLLTLTVNAQQNPLTLYLPQSKMEVLDLNSSAPAHATVYDGGSAIITDDKKLLIYNDGEYIDYALLQQGNPGQIRYLGDNKLLVNDDLQLYVIDLTDLSQAPTPFNYGLDQITASYFDLNSNYLATVSNNKIFLYSLNGTTATNKSELPVNPKLPSPVCVNQDGKIFFIRSSDSKLCVYDGSEILGTPILSSGDGISNMISKDGVLYYTTDNSVRCISEDTREIDGVSPTQLVCSNQFADYDLGNIETPTDMHFFGEDLVITDSQKNAVQQFSIVDNQLVFTGKAIAKDKTAFNRISKDASKIAISQQKVAVLDSYKLTVLPNDDNFDTYDAQNYQNYLTQDLENPLTFALGNDSVLLGYDNGVKKLNLLNDQLDLEITQLENLKNLLFFNDTYYALCSDGVISTIYAIDENLLTVNKIAEYQYLALGFTVDVYQNVYTYNQTEVYKNGELLISTPNVSQLFTDLNANLYAVIDNKICYLDVEQNTFEDFIADTDNIQSVANSISSNNIYILKQDSEYIYKCNANGYSSIDNAVLPSDFKLTDTTVSSQLKVYTINQDSFAYGIETDEQIKYISQIQPETEYAYVSLTTIDGVNGQVEYLLLAGEKGIALTHLSSATLKQVNYDTQVNQTVYVATDVNVYYLPIITKTNAYTLVQDDTIVRLAKGTVFSPEYTFTFNNIEYYYANVGTNENPVYGYLPVNFTVKVLADNVEYSNYTVERVTATTLYADELLTQEILVIPEGQTVRVYQNNNGILKVWYKTADGYIEGYISSNAIVDNPNLQIRNILVVLAVSACLCGSITYFVLRSKRD